MSEAYLGRSQKSMVKRFCENSSQLLAANYFCKKNSIINIQLGSK